MKDLLDAARAGDPAFYKTALPLPFVVGEPPVEVRGGTLCYTCTFHDDHDPSMHVWQEPDGAWRFKCSPCGVGGDVIDYIREQDGCNLSDALRRAADLLSDLPSGWESPVPQRSRPALDTDAVDRAQLADRTPLYDFLRAKGIDVDPEGLAEAWGLGCAGQEIVVPYVSREGEVVAWKHRTAETPALAAPGSNLRSVLYGEWRDTDPQKPVLLCEGESDAWVAQSVLPQLSVLSLPSASTAPTPATVNPLSGRVVYLALDGDDAGRAATERWAAALLKEGCDVRFVPVPEGSDLRENDPAALVAACRTLKAAPETIREEGSTYVRPGKDTNTMLSNWRLDLTRELVGAEGSTAYEGVLVPTGRSVTITPSDLSTRARIVNWSARWGVTWLGSDRDAVALLALFQSRGPFLPAGRLVDTAGLHGTSFVWPGGRVGRDGLVYAPPSYDVHLEQRLRLEAGDFTPLQVTALRSLHRGDVMDPILGWLAVAPLRSLLPSFPTLAVTGSSGSGKTTLLSTVMQAFSGADISTNLTSTTKHALASFMACTNAFPVWFDEYRPGARKDTQMALDQLLRDAYTAQISAKGGLGEHWSEISAMHTHAPVVVSGEDTFVETSHTERMVNLPLPHAGKNPDALRQVKDWGPTGLPRAYLEWLSRQIASGAVSLVPEPFGPAGLPGRGRDNLGVVRLGWRLLDEFVMTHGAPSLGEPDLSLVVAAASEASSHNPIRDALLWAADEGFTTANFIARSDEYLWVRVDSFVAFIERSGAFQLPGRAAAVKRFLTDHYEATPDQLAFQGRPAACLRLSLCLLV